MSVQLVSRGMDTVGRDWVGEGCANMAFSIIYIGSISSSVLEPLVGVRQMRCLRCSRLFLTLLSLRCVPSPTIVSGGDSLWPVCP